LINASAHFTRLIGKLIAQFLEFKQALHLKILSVNHANTILVVNFEVAEQVLDDGLQSSVWDT
jgi:hypothetical protein